MPDANPTADHRRTFEPPADWPARGRTVVRFEGVESCARVWLNGVELGFHTGSRLTSEYDVTEVLQPGRNVLAVRVHQWSGATYAEDQDQWWLPGVFRPVTLRHLPDAGVDDVFVRAGYDHEAGTGSLDVECVMGVRLQVPEPGPGRRACRRAAGTSGRATSGRSSPGRPRCRGCTTRR
ncbi:hypothetical protein GCM10025868_29930 [Angustibacter aerolatus]|uniref:beta-galactosidase n=1 Tax=Angustibacter aerolatus TaxID=1162965 RepID=A0ABQ6JHR1_9ACTN|nr:sugar-binding domain-containing protein [Angustibacter aerolatus]GMA87743.1 hypothetical protein GCM10025868_29930 [Angustibacter aerolatus]